MAIAHSRNPESYWSRLTLLKKLFWVYFLLLIFEGVLRKWVVPQLSAPLLIVRDPIAVLIIWEAYRSHKWPQRWSAVIAILTVVLVTLFVLQIVAGNNPLVVGLYGLRSYLLPFPVLFIMGEDLDEKDVRALGIFTLWMLIPETALLLAQYVAPPGSFLNTGAYEGGAQIAYIGGHVRSSGTFSFVVGAEFFVALAAGFILYGITTPGFAKKWLLWAGVFATILSVPTMGSRIVLVQLAGMVICLAIGATMGLSHFGNAFRVVFPLLLLSAVASQLPIFSDAMQNLTERVMGANATEGGTSGAAGAIIHRTTEPILGAIDGAISSNDWMGLGMGSLANAMNAFSKVGASDNEFEREIKEFGIVGIGLVLFKLFLAFTLIRQSLARAREEQPLALLMLPLVLSLILFATPEQPSEQGFMVVSTAVCIAAARAPAASIATVQQMDLLRQQLLQRRRRQRA